MNDKLVNNKKLIKLVTEYKQNPTIKVLNAILDELDPIVRITAKRFFIEGMQVEDIEQEARIIIIETIIPIFDPKKSDNFVLFTIGILRKRIISLLKRQCKFKRKPKGKLVSLSDHVENCEQAKNDYNVKSYLESKEIDPLVNAMENERTETLYNLITYNITDMEYRVLKLYLKDYTYDDISRVTGYKKKQVDNAIMRLKRRAEKIKEDLEIDIYNI